MRWFWIDRFVEFESGNRAVATKNVSLAEEHLGGMVPGYPVLPASLIVEGIAQTGGLLVGEVNQFAYRVVLAKIARTRFYDLAMAGDTLQYEATISDVKDDGGIVSAVARCGEKTIAETELVFAHLRMDGVELFYPADLLHMLRVMKLYEVGRTRDGQPLEVPPYLLEAEIQRVGGKPETA